MPGLDDYVAFRQTTGGDDGEVGSGCSGSCLSGCMPCVLATVVILLMIWGMAG